MIFAIPPEASQPMIGGDAYEISNIILAVAFLIHCYHYRGKWDTLKIFGIGMLYGLFLENSGTYVPLIHDVVNMLFPSLTPLIGEGFFYEQQYRFYLFQFNGVGFRLSQVPLCTHLGWCMIFYFALTFWEKISEAFPNLRKKVVVGGLIIASSGLLIDLQLDIVASRLWWWTWNDLYATQWWFGVPITNYIAWFTACAVFGAFWVWIHQSPKTKDWEPKKLTKRLLWFTPVIIAVDGVMFFAIQGLFNAFGLIFV